MKDMTMMPDRQAFRADWNDYNSGLYFVTICSHEKKHLFGDISDDEMHLSEIGTAIDECVRVLSKHHADAEVWNYVIMPNHIHMVIYIDQVGTRYIASAPTVRNIGCLKPPKHTPVCDDFHHNSRLSVIVGSLKAAVTRKVSSLMRTRYIASLQFGNTIWQKRYHEHIIRNNHSLDNIMKYIENNVINWKSDCFYQL